MKRIVLSLVLTAAAALAVHSQLVLVETGERGDARAIAGMGLKVVEDMGDHCLVHAVPVELQSLGLPFRVLDSDPEGKLYVFATPSPGFDRSRLGAYGTVLWENELGLLLRTDDASVYGMNALPVELARITLDEVVFAETDAGLPELPVVDDSLVWALVNAVSEDSVEAHIQRLQDFYTRYSTHESTLVAMEWIRSRLEAYGCDTTFMHPFRSGYAPNAVGIRYGTTRPEIIYGICGHSDATSDYEPFHCPGSDDNASGTAAVLEACRVLQAVDVEYTVLFLGFSGEEQGLYGSDAYAREARMRGDSIRAILNFDMISYGRENVDTLEVIGKRSNPSCEWLVDFFVAQADTFSALKAKKYMTNYAPYSDHHSFWQQGFVSFCGIENDFTPCYHEIGDTIGPLYYVRCGTNNIPMATSAIRAAVASLAKFAGAHGQVGVGEPGGAPGPVRIARVVPSMGAAPVRVSLTRPLTGSGAVEFFDAVGRSVRTIRSAGATEVSWNGEDSDGDRLSPGIYLVRATDGGWNSTAKAILTE